MGPLYSNRQGCHHSLLKLMLLVFFPFIFLSALWLVWIPLSVLHTQLILLDSVFSIAMTQESPEARGAAAVALLQESSFPFPVLTSKKENLCNKNLDREVPLGEEQEGRKSKSNEITLPFLHVLGLLPTCSASCRTPCPAQHGAASLSTECHWPPFCPREEQEMAILPVSPAESSANELKNVFK